MTDTHLIDERLRRFVATEDDSDWQDVLRRAKGGRRFMVQWGAGIPPLSRRPPWVAQRRRLVGLSAAAAVVIATGVVVGLMLTTASPQNAYAAAKRAVAATSAGALDSGTMTLTSTRFLSNSDASMVTTVRWNRKDFAIASQGEHVIPGFVQLLLIEGGVYLQRADGSWLHYASEADLGSLDATVQQVRELAAGSLRPQILASVYDLQQAAQPDGSTMYTGTIPPGNPAEASPADGPKKNMLPSFSSGGAFQLVVGSDGLVTQMSETASPPVTGSWSIDYSQLGTTPPITRPASYTEGTSADLPTLLQQTTTPRERRDVTGRGKTAP
jgi:hypothetical protein